MFILFVAVNIINFLLLYFEYFNNNIEPIHKTKLMNGPANAIIAETNGVVVVGIET